MNAAESQLLACVVVVVVVVIVTALQNQRLKSISSRTLLDAH